MPKLSSFVSKVDFSSDDAMEDIIVKDKKFLPLICYEIIFNRFLLKKLLQIQI